MNKDWTLGYFNSYRKEDKEAKEMEKERKETRKMQQPRCQMEKKNVFVVKILEL